MSDQYTLRQLLRAARDVTGLSREPGAASDSSYSPQLLFQNEAARMLNLRSGGAVILAALGAFVSGIPAAHAGVLDSTNIAIGAPNTGLGEFAGPFANLRIDLTSTTTADVTYTSLTNGGYIYLLGGHAAADLNVNGSYTLGPVVEANAISGFRATFDANAPGNVSSFGKFDLSLNNSGGFDDAATSISFTLTDTGAPWLTAAGVLSSDNAGYLAGIHAFACAEPACSSTSGAAISGFAANEDPPAVIPEPSTLALLGVALAGVAVIRQRYVRSRVGGVKGDLQSRST